MNAVPASIGSHRIERELGRGGMGVVYLARDTRLDRLVAIKALPAHLSADPDRLGRFEREAKALASLSHPNIGAIFGLEEADGQRFLVLEYVEGETLAERLGRGAIPIDEALPIAAQIAEGLEVAHEKGIVHRDLKPGNVMVTPEGAVKVLDFGLARTADGAPSSSGAHAASPDSPTLTSPVQRPAPVHSPTIPGVILGTAGYMSPEQARGKPVDKRSDIFSFGCVLYEMLTGDSPFPGETVTDSIGAILHLEPKWSALPHATPPRIRELLASCLAKDRRNRLHDIGDARLAIASANASGPGGTAGATRARRWAAWGVAAAVGAALTTGAWTALRPPASGQMPVILSSLEIAPGTLIDEGDGPAALSPDGRTLAFIASPTGEQPRIWIRPLDSLAAQPLQGTDDATFLFWSPDGKNLGFFSKNKLRRIPATGGTVASLADVDNPRGGTWGADGTIVYAPAPYSGLMRVASTGGAPAQLTELPKPQQTHRLPCFLPDGKRLLYTSGDQTQTTGSTEIVLLDLATGKATPLVKAPSLGLYAPPGYLLFVRDSKLMAQALDVSKAALVGEAVAVAENVSTSANRYTGAISVSAQGTLVYRPSRALARLEWLDMEGRSLGKVGEPAEFVALRLAPGGDRAGAVIRREDGRLDLWVCDTARGARSRIVEDVGDFGLSWSPDGARVTYTDLKMRCHVREIGGAMTDVILTDGFVSDWSRDGKLMCLGRQDPKTFMDLYLMDAGGGEPRAFRRTVEGEELGQFSPDGRWLVYAVAQPVGANLFVARTDGSGETRQVTSSGTGVWSAWLDDGTLVFEDPAGEKLLGIPTKITDAAIEFGAATPFFTGPDPPSGPTALTHDGKRMLVAVPLAKGKSDSLVLVQNWLAGVAPRR